MEPLGFLSLGKNGCTGLAQRRLTGCRNIRIIEISGHAAFQCCMVLRETSRNTEAIWIVERIGSMKKKVQAWLAAAMTATMLMSHAALPAVHAEEINRNDLSVLILGDDVSAGVGLQEGEQAYGELVASYLGTENVQNYAQEGATTDSLLNLIQTDDIVQASIAEADIILISVGANDIYQTVLQNEYINVADYSTMQEVLNQLEPNTRLNLMKYLRSAMPPVVEKAISNIQEITKAVYVMNSGADIVFQELYNPFSVSKDTTGLTNNGMTKMSLINTKVDDYLKSEHLIFDDNEHETVGINLGIHALQQARCAEAYTLFLNHGWYYTDIGTLGLQPNGIGQLAIAQATIQTLNLPGGDGTELFAAYQNSGAAESLPGVDATVDQNLQTLSRSTIEVYRKGDVDHSGEIELADATMALTQYAEQSVANCNPLNVVSRKAADVNQTPGVDLGDATLLLTFYAEKAVGNVTEEDFDEFVKQNS